jgi:hypothetical protein
MKSICITALLGATQGLTCLDERVRAAQAEKERIALEIGEAAALQVKAL